MTTVCGFGFSGTSWADLLHHWDLTESRWTGDSIEDLAGGWRAKASAPPNFRDGALVLDEACHVEAPLITHEKLPKTELSVEAWVNLGKGQRWGNLIGYLQDNGSYERGWSLGYNETAFLFWLSTGGSMITVTADRPFRLNEWAHVAATFDGNEIRLYVNGKLAGKKEARGEIAYPEKALYTIGAYRDDNEFYPMSGKMRSARVYSRALGDDEIRVPAGVPRVLEFSIRPSAMFLGGDRARITWLTTESDDHREVVEIGKDETFDTVVESVVGAAGDREAVVTGLEPRAIYRYRIRSFEKGTKGKGRTGAVYELNTALNFVASPLLNRGSPDSQEVSALMDQAGVRKGYAVLFGNPEADFAAELARQSKFTILGFDTDRERIEFTRRTLYAEKLYGSRISLTAVESLERLPVTSGMADLVISDTETATRFQAEIDRLLAPGRGVAGARSGDGWKISRKAPASGTGEWTHQYGDPGNTTTSGESLGGARSTADFAVQWFGRPGADFGLDRQSRMPAPLAANGRLFHQGMQRLVALNAHNGAVLWGLEVPDLMRLNMPRDASNWCVDSDSLYVAVRERAWVLDAETGERKAALAVPEAKNAATDWGYIGRAGNRLLGSAVKPDSGYRSYWSGKMWFDGKAGSIGTAKVCGDSLFAFSSDNLEPVWKYREGKVIHTTIAAADGRVVFVESRNPALEESRTSQIAGPQLWMDQFLVALDLSTGEKLWEQPLDTEDGTITFYLQAAPGAILITASNTQYHLYAFDPKNGNPLWDRSHPWPNDHHSGHIQHPVILGGTIYLQPNGYDLASGDIVTTKVGSRSGCHTYIGAENALIYRGAGRQVALWDRENETVSAWDRLRPSCWLSLIPANGMLLVPEGGGGCSCGGWMETSIGFSPLAPVAKPQPGDSK